MKVLLIDPRAPSFGLNVALGYLAASLKRDGIHVCTLDLNNRRDIQTGDDIEGIIGTYKPDLIGFSVLYTSLRKVYEYSHLIKKRVNAKIVLGGPQIAIERERALADCNAVDYVIVGEGEFALSQLCQAVENGAGFENVDGLIYREKDKIKHNSCVLPCKDVDALPFPDYESFGVSNIYEYPILTSRGCPYNCNYCFRQFGRDWRPRSPGNIIAELDFARSKYDIKKFVIHDDSFNINRRRVVELCELLLKKNYNMKWSCAGVRADAVNDGLASAMAGAGCESVSVGVETLNEEVFEKINKGESINDIVNAIGIFKRNGIRVIGYFIIGLPGDDYRGVMCTFKKARRMGLDDMSWSVLLPIPRTKMYDDVYSDPLTRRINDYRDIDMVWLRELSNMRVAFDHPSFTQAEKLRAYYKITTINGHICPRLDRSRMFAILNSLYLIIRYAPNQLPLYALRTIARIVKRMIKGAAPIKMLARYNENLVYRDGYLQDGVKNIL